MGHPANVGANRFGLDFVIPTVRVFRFSTVQSWSTPASSAKFLGWLRNLRPWESATFNHVNPRNCQMTG
jgi:hypothetical protein